MIGQTISHYKIVEKLGEGGMGVVYKAEDTKLKRTVALKFLSPDLTRDEAARQRFIHEAQTASGLDHPNIGVVHEIDETPDGQSFICMTFYGGETLRAKMDRGPLTIRQTVEIAIQISAGLQRAHEADIVHRDIKPANIIVTDDGTVKIVDFGLAKLGSDPHSTSSYRHIGTAAYMSPEQVKDGTADARSDLFSLGVVLYEMVTGVRPFEGEHEAALFYSIVNLEPRFPSGVRSDLPKDLERIILRLLQKESGRRYQRASELHHDLMLLEKGIKLPSTARFQVAVSFVREKRLILTLVVCVCVIAGIVVWQKLRPRVVSLRPSDIVVLAEFANQTKDSVFNHSITEAMKVALRQSARINLLSVDRIAGTLQLMRLPADHPIDEVTALSIAQREGARAVISGTFSEIKSHYLLQCKIVEASTGDIVDVLLREIPSVGDLLPGIDRLSGEIRESLGESLKEISKDATPLEKVTTSSIEALELYSRGNSLEGQGKYQESAVLKSAAVGLDSTFTIAISDLSYIRRKLGNDSLAIYYHNRVLPLIDRVTDRERFYILTIYYGTAFELNFPKALENAEQFVMRYPNAAEGFATLGHLEMYIGDIKAAREANLHSLALDSTYAGTVFNNSGYAEALAGNADEAIRFFRLSKSIRPTYYAIDQFMAHAYWLKSELDSAEHILQSIVPFADPMQQIRSHSSLASLYYFKGELDRAENECRAAIDLCRSLKRPAIESVFHFLLGEFAIERGDRNGYIPELRRAELFCGLPFYELVLIGASYARNGYVNDAERISNRIKSINSIDPYFTRRRDNFLHLIAGELFLTKHTPELAAREFVAIEKINSGDPVYLTAQKGIAKCAASSSKAIAIEKFNSLLDQRGETVMGPMLSLRYSGPWSNYLWPEVDLEIAKLSLGTNDSAEAEQHLRECLRCWKNADPRFRKAKEANELLVQLIKGR